MSVIIDASLSRTPIMALPEKNGTIEYIRLLAECGVKYFEIDPSLLTVLEDEDLSKKYIFRVNSWENATICRKKRFAYVVIPWKLRRLCGAIAKQNRVILEINIDHYNAPAMIMCALSSKYTKSISMLRVNNYSYSPTGEEIDALLKWYKRRYMLPIDICPMNYYMTGNVCAMAAEKNGADAITLTYGRNVETTALENFLVEKFASRARDIPFEIITSMSRAIKYYFGIFLKMPYGFNNIEELSNRVECPLADISSGQMYRIYRVRRKRVQPKENVIEKKVKSLGYDEQMEDLIIQLLDKVKIS